jgi:hypothetical protein
MKYELEKKGRKDAKAESGSHLTHSPTHSLTYSLTHLLTHSPTNSQILDAIATLSNSMNELKSAASGGAIEGIPVSDVRSLRLPKDVTQWRVLHVQAWVAITMELPLYMDNFQQGSINGLVLLHHVTEDVLVNILGIADDLHLKKIMGGQRLLTHSRTYLITHSLANLLTH